MKVHDEKLREIPKLAEERLLAFQREHEGKYLTIQQKFEEIFQEKEILAQQLKRVEGSLFDKQQLLAVSEQELRILKEKVARC